MKLHFTLGHMFVFFKVVSDWHDPRNNNSAPYKPIGSDTWRQFPKPINIPNYGFEAFDHVHMIPRLVKGSHLCIDDILVWSRGKLKKL